MAPVVFPVSSSHPFLHKIANSSFSIKQNDTQPSPAFSASSTPSNPISNLPAPTVFPHILHEKFSTIIVSAPSTTYTSYIELNNNAFSSVPTSLPDSTSTVDSSTLETQAPQPNNAGRDVGIVIGCIIGVLILGLIGWVYMMKVKQTQRRRKKGKGKVKVQVEVKRRKRRKRRKHRKTERKKIEQTAGEAPAAEGS